jgi:hypothetical protein
MDIESSQFLGSSPITPVTLFEAEKLEKIGRTTLYNSFTVKVRSSGVYQYSWEGHRGFYPRPYIY